MKTRIYLASKYSRRSELLGYAKELEAEGVEVTSRWLLEHSYAEEKLGSEDREGLAKIAEMDVEDLARADTIVAFTESPNTAGSSRGGRHVELGMAIAGGHRIVIVGPRENIFCNLPEVHFFREWGDRIAFLIADIARMHGPRNRDLDPFVLQAEILHFRKTLIAIASMPPLTPCVNDTEEIRFKRSEAAYMFAKESALQCLKSSREQPHPAQRIIDHLHAAERVANLAEVVHKPENQRPDDRPLALNGSGSNVHQDCCLLCAAIFERRTLIGPNGERK